MELKFYLNKFLKVDNIEGYTLHALQELKKVYDKFTDKTEGFDPDFPMMSIGDKKNKGKTIATGKNNVYQTNKEDESDNNIDPLDEGDFTLTK